MVRLGRKADKQWRFVGQDVKDVQDLTLAHIRAVYGLGSAALDGQGNSKESADETDSADASVNVSIFPYCGNRYDRTDVEDFSRSKGTSTTCSAARCKDGNPHCLNYMGQDQWENDDAFDKYFAERARGPNPELALRPKDTPAGMKNLGATCYANSLLQVWFHDLAFRNAIYQCHFEQNGDKSMNALYQLQLLFAHLDRGSKEFYNPQSLIASLKLDTTMQQDAQEFCNLFMARIDNQLQRQPKEHLGRFVNDQRCKKTSVRDCTFYELLLNIKDNCTLMDCLEEFVEPEELTGADQRDKWFVLNDEEVAEFHGSKFDAEDYSEAESKPKAKKKATIDKGREAEKNLNILSSRNAYMLTYTKVDSKSPVAPNAPPVEALDIVLQDNANLFNEVEEYTRYKESVKLDFEKARAERRELYRCWNVNSDEDDRFYVSAPTLSSYIYLGGGTRTVLDNSSIACQHGKLCPNAVVGSKAISQAMEVLQRTFGPLDLPGTDALECDVCRDQLQPHVDNLKEMMARASSEKSELVELMMRGARVRQMQPSRKYYAVSIDGFMRKWLDFVKKPASHARPGAIDNSGLLCKHDLFIFDLNNAADAESDDDLYIVNEEEWAYFRAIYGGGPEIVLTRTEAMDTDGNVVVFHLQSAPDVCCTCRNERILDFSCTTLLIRVFNSGETADGLSLSKADPFTPTGEDASCVAHPTAVQKLKRKQQPASAIRPEFLGTRRSKRSKTTKTPYKEIKILVSKWETVMELKLKIMQKTNIVPLYQKLVYDKAELDKNEITIADLEIPPNAVLDLIAFDQSTEHLDLSSLQDVVSMPGDEGGFGGTGLTEEWL
ncbi:hypothetical protein EDD11_010192 [Mortierella claussenii]|nr:hypothetical protein EDD11_010192 [Mortierella claussenii]